MNVISIGALSRATGVKPTTIRFYEGIGLMPEPDRTVAGRRVYRGEATDRLRFIRHARELGFKVDAMRQLLALANAPARSCEEVDRLASTHLAEIESRIASLVALRTEVKRMLGDCAHGKIKTCRVIEVLADHSQCVADSH